MNLAGFVARTKYYAVWCMALVRIQLYPLLFSSFCSPRHFISRSETAFIVAGLGYNPQTKHYDASRNVRIGSIELAPNFKVSFEPSQCSLILKLNLILILNFTDPTRFLEHEYECLVEGMHLQASCKDWKETWVSQD